MLNDLVVTGCYVFNGSIMEEKQRSILVLVLNIIPAAFKLLFLVNNPSKDGWMNRFFSNLMYNV